MSTLRVSCATVNQTPLDWTGNFENILTAIKEAQTQHSDIICFPELSVTGYGSEDLFLSYWYPLKALKQLQNLIPYCRGISVVVGLPIRLESNLYNCVAIIEDAKLKGIVAKQFMAIDGVHYEFRWFTPWSHGQVVDFDFFGTKVPLGDLVFELKGIKYGFEICEDAWRGKTRPGYRLKERKTEIIFNPSASHFAMGKTLLREDLVKESAEIFDATYVYCNLLGNETGRMIFDGEIMVAQQGKLMIKNELLSFKDYQVITFDYHKNLSLQNQELNPFHSKEEEFVQAAALGLFDYLRKSKSKGYVLSLSGGADSSTIAVLVAEMVRRGINELGLENFLKKINLKYSPITENPAKEIVGQIFTTAYQASKNSSDSTFESAKALAESIGAKFVHWEIAQEVASYTQKIEQVLGRKLTWETDDIALQNIQARARSPIIWMLANIKNSLLLSTSNRSEGDVGYATMDGDTSGSLSPIAAVDKYFIIQWLKWAEKELHYPGLSKVNQLQPTAELRPLETQQTDESDLMPYSLIVEIEKLAIRDKRSPLDVYLILMEETDYESALLKSYVKKFFRLWSRNQWKRERFAPSFHLDEFNIDPKTWFRFPILSGSFEEELKELDTY